MDIKIIKKDGSMEQYEPKKVVNAVMKSAERVGVVLSKEELDTLCKIVEIEMTGTKMDAIPVAKMHTLVELALDKVNRRCCEEL